MRLPPDRLDTAGGASSLVFGAQNQPIPLAFGPIAGQLYGARGDVGIVVVPGFGLEALSLTRSFHIFGKMAAGLGFPTLTYDHPGSGDSANADQTSLADWVSGVSEAADMLRRYGGARHIVLMGHGLGALVALHAAGHVSQLAGVIAMAPPASGRAYVREEAALATLTGSETLSGGFAFPGTLMADLKAVVLSATDIAPFYILACRPNRLSDGLASDAISARGVATFKVEYSDFDVTDPTLTRPPRKTFERILELLLQAAPLRPGNPPEDYEQTDIVEPGYAETGFRFGPDDRLYGVYCRPTGGAALATAALLIGAGRDPQIGWARATVDQARALARSGIASLRFDPSGVGIAGEPAGAGELLYSSTHVDDVVMAAAALTACGHDDILLAGRCSGAYLAFHAAARVPNLKGLFAVNILRLIWDPSETVESAIHQDIRPLKSLAARLVDPATLNRVLKGDIKLADGGRKLSRALMKRLPDLPLSDASKRRKLAREMLAECLTRGVTVTFASSAGDPSEALLRSHFGAPKAAIKAFPGMRQLTIDNADHNLTAPAARQALIRYLIEAVRS